MAWPVAHGFLDKPLNPATGTTHLGARDYDPKLARFLSVDPLLDPTDPQSLNGYTYADNNPITKTDPTGLGVADYLGPGQAVNDHKNTDNSWIKHPATASGGGAPPAAGAGPIPGWTQDQYDTYAGAWASGSFPLGAPPPGSCASYEQCMHRTGEILRANAAPGSPYQILIQVGDCPMCDTLWRWGSNAVKLVGDITGITGCFIDHNGLECAALLPVGKIVKGGKLVDDAVRASRGAKNTKNAAKAAGALVDSGKYDYLFGKVASSSHNAARSAQNAQQLARIGVYDNATGRALLQSHFDDVVAKGDNIVRSYTDAHGTFQVRDSLFFGPGGSLKFESTWQVTDSGLRLTTVIPMGGP
ncbi:MAG: hypothetical protein FWD74_01355 [Actinomycetia bacterium]|nr:hypothetical protein [Actinomycetes bacterium]